MDIGIIKMSSKGQIVIPASMRKDLVLGEQLLIIREGNRFILKPLEDLEPAMEEDIRFAERTEKAFLEFERGSFTKEEDVDFIKKMKTW